VHNINTEVSLAKHIFISNNISDTFVSGIFVNNLRMRVELASLHYARRILPLSKISGKPKRAHYKIGPGAAL